MLVTLFDFLKKPMTQKQQKEEKRTGKGRAGEVDARGEKRGEGICKLRRSNILL